MKTSDIKYIEIKNVTKEFVQKKGNTKKSIIAVDNVSLDIYKGETLGLIGGSGSGKTTLGRMILRLISLTKGEIILDNEPIHNYSKKEFRALRKDIQIIFQDATYALDPRKKIKDILIEPLYIHNIVDKSQYEKEVYKLLEVVGLSSNVINKYPHEFSGGEKQRITIAKTLATRPKFIVCDEPVSALDVSVQAKILNLLDDLKSEFDLTYLFIAHSLNVVNYIADRVAVMHKGKIVEIGDPTELFKNPKHEYTKTLISNYIG